MKKVKADGSADSKVGKGKWELDRNRFVSISEFKGRKSVDIRKFFEKFRLIFIKPHYYKIFILSGEFYMDKSSNEMKPGKKGISLSKSEWEKLQKLIPEINNEF